MSTLRSLWLCVAGAALAACAGTGGGRTAVNEAAVANMNLGAGYLQQGRLDLAVERLQRALAQNPRLVHAHSTIALAYDQLGDLEQAEMHFRRATELDSSDGGAANAYAVFLCSRQNRWADAEPYFRRAVADSDYPTPEAALTNAGVCALSAGDVDAATRSFREALTRNPTFSDALRNMMELSYQRGDFLQTRAFVQRYLDAFPPTAPVLWLCFNVERELENAAGADRCAAQLRTGFQNSSELAQLEEQQRGDGR